MKGLLADHDIQGYVDVLVACMQSEPWKPFWDHLSLNYVHFSDVGLPPNAPDSIIWRVCQERQLILITNNRTENEPDSLETTIRLHNTPTCLPIFTIGKVQRLRYSGSYADEILESLPDALLRIDSLRGTGRLYLP